MTKEMLQAEVVCACRCELGEGPLWNVLDHRVYWTDIPRGTLHRLEPESRRHESFAIGGKVGGFTIQVDKSLLLFMENGAIRIWREGHLTDIVSELPAERGTRFNDVIADPKGRVFCGTMPGSDGKARLYRLDVDGRITLIREGIGLANGMGFTPDETGLYFTDTVAQEIMLVPYDVQSGELGTPRQFAHVPEAEGKPDGLTVDAEGYVWSARWDGHGAVRYSPDGKVNGRLSLPVANVTSLAFGGKDLSDLYLTTAGGNEPSASKDAGNLFRCRPSVGGKSEYFSRVRLS